MITITLVCTLAALWPSAGSPAGIQPPGRTSDWLVLIYLAVVAGSVTMLLQTWAQAHLEASRAAVIMAWSRSGRPGSPSDWVASRCPRA